MATVETEIIQVPTTRVKLTLSVAEAQRVATRLITPLPAIKGDDNQDIGQQINAALA
jgi:hypothetical protein